MHGKRARFPLLLNRAVHIISRQSLIKVTALGLSMLSLNACSTSYVREYIEVEGAKSGNWVQKNNSGEVKIVAEQVDGPIIMNEAETDVLEFPSNASILVSMQAAQDLEMEVKRDGKGPIKTQYKVDGKARTREQMTDAQLQTLWQHFFRRTGLSLKERSARIIKKDGIEGLITEITQLTSNLVTRKYLSHISQNYELNTKQVDSVISIVGNISSNSEKSRAYKSVLMGKTLLSESQLLTLIDGSSSISSNRTLADLLYEMLEMDIPAARAADGKLTSAFTNALLKASTEISSNSQLASFLEALIDKVDDQDLLASIITTASDNISSDSSLADLYAQINQQTLSQENTRVLIRAAAEHIGSNNRFGDLLLDIAQSENFRPALIDDLMQASQSISSGYQREKLLETLVGLQ